MQLSTFNLILWGAFLIPRLFYGGIINVPVDQPTIQGGINAALNGDTVLVAPGTYFENINFNGKNITVASHFILNKDDHTYISSTIIDGSNPSYPDSASCVRIVSGEDSTAVLMGFTLTGGKGTKWTDIHIGGVYTEGGGILIEFSSPTIMHNIITNNSATSKPRSVVSAGGGAIRSGDGNPRILNNIIKENQGFYGAGIVLNYSGAIIKNNIIYRNSGGQDFGGGGIWCNNDGPAPIMIENNTIVENSSTGSGTYSGSGGAIMVWSTTIILRNNIIRNNTQSSGDQIGLVSRAEVDMKYCNIEGGFDGEGNIDLDPSFAIANFFLMDDSPCIDSGDPNPVYNDPEDPANAGLAKWPARGGLRSDIGAYGGPLSAIILEEAVIGVQLSDEVPSEYRLEQNYPNPFNPSTRIEFSIPKESLVHLAVYDIQGSLVKTLINYDFYSPGFYSFEWTGKDMYNNQVSSGIYFLRLESDNFKKTVKMNLIK